MKIFHNSRENEYRSPYGALPFGEAVTLRVKIAEADNISSVYLRVWIDGIGESIYPMLNVNKDIYEIKYTPPQPCIVWYRFIVNGQHFSKCGDLDWQITCYKFRKVPDWYKNAIIYQIFPDRYNKDNITNDWYKKPVYQKDQDGNVIKWDFFGGTLKGIEDKLEHLKEIGITALYLNPIFSAKSNHRYDTSDFSNVDYRLGGNEDFVSLCKKARQLGMHIILDGVFNHTGIDSKYFREHKDWYFFDNSPIGYKCWWGVKDLPTVDKNNPEYRKLVFSTIRKWLDLGASGWRLDVADELPDEFIAEIKKRLNDEEVLIGEVWEDASNKISYGNLRKYLLGEELDSVMNYPIRKGIIEFLTYKINASDLCETINSLKENYPKEAFYSSLNIISSHDRARILTELGNNKDLVWKAVLFQMSIPGVPCIYYGDEAGLTGGTDPENRAGYPWNKEDPDCLNIYHNAISVRKTCSSLIDGDFVITCNNNDEIIITRENNEEKVCITINRSGKTNIDFNRKCAELSKPMKVGTGILCHTSSLPNGKLDEGYRFVDWLNKKGYSYWQILPLNPVDKYGSPYAGLSAFDIIYPLDEWLKLKKYANSKNVQIIGDLPLYVSRDSIDAREHPEYFNFDKTAGVPPDKLAPNGQSWGNPVYNWKYSESFWLHRLEHAFKLYDYVRIDHFRGFLAYWTIEDKKWNIGPGYNLFKKAYEKFGPLPVIAEDLGIITDAVNILRKKCGFMGMDVIQFRDGIKKENCILYSGTHDTETLVGFFNGNKVEAKKTLNQSLKEDNIVKIFPLQDILLLDNDCRMNTPGTTENNWKWRFNWEELDNA